MCFLSEPQGCPVASQTFRVGRLIKLCTKELGAVGAESQAPLVGQSHALQNARLCISATSSTWDGLAGRTYRKPTANLRGH